MHGRAGGIPARLPAPRGRKAAFVQGVSGLVHHGEHAGHEVALVGPHGDANVVARTAHERVPALIEAAMQEVEPHPAHQFGAEACLCAVRRRDAHRCRGRALAFHHRSQQCGQERLELGKEGAHLGLAQPRIEFVEQRLIRRDLQCNGLRSRAFADQPQHRLQVRPQPGEVIGRLGLAPCHLALGGGAVDLLDQAGIDCGRVNVAVTDAA